MNDMIRINDNKQMPLFDSWGHLGPKRRRMLEENWPGLFQREIRPVLPVDELAKYFKDDFGRPTKELYTAMGTILLQQVKNLTDEETIEQLAMNLQWHYALDIRDESDQALYICLKSLWNYREAIAANHLEEVIFEAVTAKLAKVFSVDTDSQRLDSVHIKSNMRRLGRITIFAKTIQNFLKNLKRKYPGLFALLDEKLTDKYLDKKALGVFAMVKPKESSKTLADLSSDLYYLIERFRDNKNVADMYSYKTLERVLKDQCNIVESKDKTEVSVNPPKEVPSDSLQNPSDPDATYSGHKGQGYQVQVMETFTDTEDKKVKEKTLNLITHIKVEKASDSDANALLPAIESTNERDLAPKKILADALYGSDDNVEAAKSLDVEVTSPVMGTEKHDAVGLSDFEFNAKGHVTACLMGHRPLVSKKKKNRFTQGFCKKACTMCDLLDLCPVKPGKKHCYLRYQEKAMRLARRRVHEQTEEFKDRYRWRAGVEATMSEFDRRTGVKHLRVRGVKAVCFAVFLKAAGLNIFRAAAVQKARIKCDPGSNTGQFFRNIAIWVAQKLFSPFKGRHGFISQPEARHPAHLAGMMV